MQVSWIDPEEVRALLANIEGPRKVVAASNIAWEVHTLPVVPLQLSQENIVDPPPVAKPTPPPLPPEMPLSDGGSSGAPRGGELWRIRENLRSLREQAQVSGLIPARVDQPTPPLETPALEDIAAQFAEAIDQRDAPPPPAPEARRTFEFKPSLLPEPEEPARDEIIATPPRAPTGPMIEPTPAPTYHHEELPQPKPATASLQPPSIEYSGPAPSGPDYEPLFGNVIAPEPAVTVASPEPIAPPIPESPAEALATLLEVDAEPTSAKPAFIVPALGLSDRLNALALWSCERLGSREVLLVDDYGDVLWGGHAQTPLVLSAMMAWHAGQRSTAGIACNEPERIDRPLANGKALTVIPARTRYGTVSLAAIQAEPVSAEDERAIHDALVSAVEGPVE
jgi:hypothetical protein